MTLSPRPVDCISIHLLNFFGSENVKQILKRHCTMRPKVMPVGPELSGRLFPDDLTRIDTKFTCKDTAEV